MTDELRDELFDNDDVSKDDIISTMNFKVKNFPVGKVSDSWYSFTPAKGVKTGGKVHLIFHLDRSGMTTFVA